MSQPDAYEPTDPKSEGYTKRMLEAADDARDRADR